MDPIAVSVSGVIGVVIGTLLTGLHQRANTRLVIKSEFEKLRTQLAAETHARVRARKEEWLLEYVPLLVATADPEIYADIDYKKVVTLIHKIQVILDPQNPTEAAINRAAT